MLFPFPLFHLSAQGEYLHTFRTPVAVIGTTEQGAEQHETTSARFQRAEAWCSSFSGNSISRQELTVNAHQNRGLGDAV